MFNITSLKRYAGDVVPTPDPIKLDDSPEYKVNAILCHWWVGWRHAHLECLVSIVGYNASHNEWLPTANLANAPDILCSYQNMRGLA